MTNEKQFSWRFYALILLVCAIAFGLALRMLYLNTIENAFLQQQSTARSLRDIPIPAYRGMIKDRHGEPLAISTPVDSIWANPQTFKAAPAQLQQLAALLALPKEHIEARISQSSKREFIYLKRSVPPLFSEQIQALALPGVSLQREYRRYYPKAETTAHVIGFTNIDDEGQEGMELAYDAWLRGIPGVRRVVKDRLGRVIADVGELRAPQEGKDLVLSIDSRLQYLAYTTLKDALVDHEALSGSVVILDAQNGEILAMVNLPSYNPNNRPTSNTGQYRNRAVTDVFEPGSTLKVFSMLNALASKQYTPDSLINTNPGRMSLNGHSVSDPHNLGVISLTQVLQKSSNMGISRVTLSLPEQSLPTLLYHLGFGRSTNSGFPGESPGVLHQRQRWREIELATLSFGYGISATPLQLAQAYATIAAKGVQHSPTFIKDQHEAPLRILDERTANALLLMMEKVVQREGGSGWRAAVKHYRVAGKTGTAFIMGPNGYYRDRYIASFVGMAPVSDPRLVIALVIHDPRKGGYYGSQVAAPYFSTLMAGSLHLLNIVPDALDKDQ